MLHLQYILDYDNNLGMRPTKYVHVSHNFMVEVYYTDISVIHDHLLYSLN
ncbi:hypothetical protein CDL12_14026 [Handroanthus impetiginosus]|uniref:Uncharacterized protein n=1 Tax=Handroanthus impetiginosus TaxID=429701 RepID=A0A2G9H7S6_9LAMI|nr:hypothetical protein CDL12_14026 [Handroanthus impetiginosus]